MFADRSFPVYKKTYFLANNIRLRAFKALPFRPFPKSQPTTIKSRSTTSQSQFNRAEYHLLSLNTTYCAFQPFSP
jgi:hypothetical protein